MPYDPKKDPASPYFAGRSHGAKQKAIVPGNADLAVYAEKIELHVANGGRATIVFIPANNDDADTVTMEVADGWESDTSIRRVVSVTPVTGGAAVSVAGLFRGDMPSRLGTLGLSSNTIFSGLGVGAVIGTITGKTAGSTLTVVESSLFALTGNDGAGWSVVLTDPDTPAGVYRLDLKESLAGTWSDGGGTFVIEVLAFPRGAILVGFGNQFVTLNGQPTFI